MYMSFHDYVKFVTQQFVTYVDQPKEKRKELKLQKKELKEPVQNQLFGLVPMAISVFIENRKKNRRKKNV